MVLEYFYIFVDSIAIIRALFVVLNFSNPIKSILYLVISVLCLSWVLILLGADFLGMIFVVVYIGAVAVLFLFAVMLLDIQVKNIVTSRKINKVILQTQAWQVLLAFIFLFFLEEISREWLFDSLLFMLTFDITFVEIYGFQPSDLVMWFVGYDLSSFFSILWELVHEKSNMKLIGEILYTHYANIILSCGFILLAAMIRAIILTLDEEKDDLFSKERFLLDEIKIK